ncbi:chloroplast sensor kinase [Euphorbia peplus]|nr:chloroplast sensor kinase [Euphorbia peplus]
MLISGISISAAGNLLFSAVNTPIHLSSAAFSSSSSSLRPVLSTKSSTSSTTNINSSLLHQVARTLPDDDQPEMLSSASAVASAIRKGSNSPVVFEQKIEEADNKSKLVLPSIDFRQLCVEQLDLFRRIVDPDAILSIYVRPAGSYVMDRLELRRITSYPGTNASEMIILVGNFNVPAGLRAAEAALSSQQVEIVPEHRALVFPMVKHPFVVGFLVAEIPMVELEASSDNAVAEVINDLIHLPSQAHTFSSIEHKKPLGMQSFGEEPVITYDFTAEQKLNAINISRSLAMAYVMDQKAMLLQQSSWQTNVRMSNLVEQIRAPLSSIQTLSKMLSGHMKRSEISYDIVEDILVEGDRMRESLQELQDAVYVTKANIMRFNEDTLKKIHNSNHHRHNSLKSQLSDDVPRDTSNHTNLQNADKSRSLNALPNDLEMPMPPLALAPLQHHGIRPCNVSGVLLDMVGAVQPLARQQQRSVLVTEISQSLQVAIEEPALRQALSNLIEGALLRTQIRGKVEIVCTEAPAGGALVVIDDDGPDMHYMTQMHSLTPFGAELLSENMIEDNMTWNFVAGLTVAREILESYGCVVRVISPRTSDAALGAGGTRIELWLPSFATFPDQKEFARDA